MTTAHLLDLEAPKTYATRENAIKAVEKKMPKAECQGAADVWYVVMQGADGRWFPLFIGERALRAGVHFHFNVAA